MKHRNPGLGRWLGSLGIAVFLGTAGWVPGGALMAEEIGWHDRLTLVPGRGVDPRNPELTSRPVMTVDLADFETSGGGDSVVGASFSQHQFDLVSRLNLNASFAVKSFLGGSGSFQFSFLDDRRYSANTLSFVFEGSRRFGGRLFRSKGLSPEFQTRADQLGATLQGEELHRQLVAEYGSHVITGWKKEAKVIVAYQFTTGSLGVFRNLESGLQATYGEADFDSVVRSLFGRTDTSVSLNYSFYSSSTNLPNGDPDPTRRFDLVGRIESYDEFVAFSSKVQHYLANVTEAEVRPTAYLIEPIQNMPGYAALLGTYSASTPGLADYTRFLKVYAQLRAWGDRLDEMILDANRMNWLNSSARQVAESIRRDVVVQLRSMERTAREHFAEGRPLVVTDEQVNYFANFNRIPIPRFGTIRNGVSQFRSASTGPNGAPFRAFAGFVNAGPKGLTVDRPFRVVTLQRNGIDVGASVPLYHSVQDFETYLNTSFGALAPAPEGRNPEAINAILTSPAMEVLKSDSETCRMAMFFVLLPVAGEAEWSLVIRDAAGHAVDWLWALASPDGGCQAGVGPSDESDVRVRLDGLESSGVQGRPSTQRWTVSNAGPGPVYGTTLRVPVDASRSEFVRTQGSQGAGEYANGTVTFEVGPLIAGAEATVEVTRIPLIGGAEPAGPSVRVGVGNGLTDPLDANDSVALPRLEVEAAEVGIGYEAGQVRLAWRSESDRLVLESAGEPTVGWSRLTGTVTVRDGRRSQVVEASGDRHFFRLNLR